MSVTINTFPPLQTFTYSRSWFLAFIVVLHIGFFWVLTHGLSIGSIAPEKPFEVVPVPTTPQAPKPTRDPVVPIVAGPFVPPTVTPNLDVDVDPTATPVQVITTEPPQTVEPGPGTSVPREPVIAEPEIGRTGLSEPLYPSQAIRMGHTGTVILSVQVLANGRVGEVRLVQSSGFQLLDESALREARRWRFVPGTRDGVATPMWKQIPITFRLRN
jgi:protein TonB